MSVLGLKILVLLLVTTSIGLIASWWRQHSLAQQRESELKLRLKVRNRNHQELYPDFDDAEEGESLEGGSTKSKVHTIVSTLDENKRLNAKILRQKSESDILLSDLTNANLELEQEQENSENLRSQAQYWEETFNELQSEHSHLEAANLSMTQQVAEFEQQIADLEVVAGERDNALAEKQRLVHRVEEEEARIAQLLQENERIESLYSDMVENHNAVSKEKENYQSKLMTAEAQVIDLEDDLAKLERRTLDIQQQSDKYKAERDALNLLHTNVSQILDTSILTALPASNSPNAKKLESNQSESKGKPPARAGTASLSMPRRIKALETIVHNQRAKIDVLRGVVEEMQTALHSDAQQFARATR